jgi:HipA-like protein
MKKKLQSAIVLYNHVPAGTLEKQSGKYFFTYLPAYSRRPVTITMPVRKATYESNILFPVFTNMLR